MQLASDYAQALYELSEGKSNPDTIVDGLMRVLKAKGHIQLLPNIVSAFERISLENRNRDTMTLKCAREKDFVTFRDELKGHLEHSDVSFTKEVVDDTLIGGYVLEKGDTVIDASYKKKLLEIYQSAIV